MRKALCALACLLAVPSNARAQEPYNLAAPVQNLATLFTELYGPQGLVVDSLATLPVSNRIRRTSTATSSSTSASSRRRWSSQLVSIPLPSPASGFTYEFDSSLGVFQRTTQSFGPSSPTAPKPSAPAACRRLRVQRFTFDTAEGLDWAGCRQCSRTTTPLLGGRRRRRDDVERDRGQRRSVDDIRDAGRHRRFDISVAVPVVWPS